MSQSKHDPSTVGGIQGVSRGLSERAAAAKSALAALAVGLLFGTGLGLSGMTQPAKVIGFLDAFGRWDPSLLFVMMGAMLVHVVFVRCILRRKAPLLDTRFHLPTSKTVDTRLVIGAAIFGVGWGLGGICPGPALVNVGSCAITPLVFVAAMAVGMTIHYLISAKR